MRPEGATFWRLGGSSGWQNRTASSDLAVSDRHGLRLTAEPCGPLSLQSKDGSFGGLTLPRGTAVDSKGKFHRIEGATSIAIVRDHLYAVMDGRVKVFDLTRSIVADVLERNDWNPVDVAAHNGTVYILDANHGRVFDQRLEIQFKRPGKWSRIAVDRDGMIYLFNGTAFERRDPPLSQITDPNEIRDLFDPLPTSGVATVAVCGNTTFILDEQNQAVYRRCAGSDDLKTIISGVKRHWTGIACDGAAIVLYEPGTKCAQVFDRNGRPLGERAVEPPKAEPSNERLYKKTGTWQSKPLDSKKYRCQWHRIQLELAEFPPGSKITVSTCAHEKEDDVYDAMRAHWVEAQTIVAPIAKPEKSHDFLVQSGAGQYLTLRVQLDSDGFSTPAVDSAKIHYPRESYLEFLPATYSSDDEMRVFLERFLSIFQTEWDDVDRQIDEMERFFDPDAVPEGELLDYLASQWLALPLEGTWNYKQKRRLLSAAPKIYPHRGQLKGLRDFIAVYLANMSGLETKDVQQMELPVIVEGFREREMLFSQAPLWSASVTRRLQLGVYATEGEAAMVSVGDPERDVFTQFAHKFRVYVPEAWVNSEDDERMIRRALDAEKPAHTQYELCLIAPRFRVGAQSTIGVDTVIGATPELRLGSAHLGFDAVLSTDARAAAELVLA